MKVRTRFAPSPTGFLHIGGLRTALYAYAFAKSQKGKFILRIEDTDLKRFVPEAIGGIYQMLKTFGLDWDEGPLVSGPYAPYIQSERVKTELYKRYAQKLIEKDGAYYCFCPPEELTGIKGRQQKGEICLRDNCRFLDLKEAKKKIDQGEKFAVRLRLPDNDRISFFDFILKKEINWETRCADEVMLLKSDGFPTYHLAAMVDDYEMKISHIIRGRDWLPSTPAHLMFFKYLNLPRPEIGHLTDILDPAGGKLSKRKGTVSCEEFLSQGYLPEAILNFVMLLGWAPKDDREFFTLEEFVKEFKKGELQVSNPVFNRKKLDWFNGVYIRKKSDQELVELIKPFIPKGMKDELVKKTIPLVKERLRKLSEFPKLIDFFVKEPALEAEIMVQSGKDRKNTREVLDCIVEEVEKIKPSEWSSKKLEKTIREFCEQSQTWETSDLFMSLRAAITGRKATPPLFETMAVLGKGVTLKRLKKAREELS